MSLNQSDNEDDSLPLTYQNYFHKIDNNYEITKFQMVCQFINLRKPQLLFTIYSILDKFIFSSIIRLCFHVPETSEKEVLTVQGIMLVLTVMAGIISDMVLGRYNTLIIGNAFTGIGLLLWSGVDGDINVHITFAYIFLTIGVGMCIPSDVILFAQQRFGKKIDNKFSITSLLNDFTLYTTYFTMCMVLGILFADHFSFKKATLILAGVSAVALIVLFCIRPYLVLIKLKNNSFEINNDSQGVSSLKTIFLKWTLILSIVVLYVVLMSEGLQRMKNDANIFLFDKTHTFYFDIILAFSAILAGGIFLLFVTISGTLTNFHTRIGMGLSLICASSLLATLRMFIISHNIPVSTAVKILLVVPQMFCFLLSLIITYASAIYFVYRLCSQRYLCIIMGVTHVAISAGIVYDGILYKSMVNNIFLPMVNRICPAENRAETSVCYTQTLHQYMLIVYGILVGISFLALLLFWIFAKFEINFNERQMIRN